MLLSIIASILTLHSYLYSNMFVNLILEAMLLLAIIYEHQVVIIIITTVELLMIVFVNLLFIVDIRSNLNRYYDFRRSNDSYRPSIGDAQIQMTIMFCSSLVSIIVIMLMFWQYLLMHKGYHRNDVSSKKQAQQEQEEYNLTSINHKFYPNEVSLSTSK